MRAALAATAVFAWVFILQYFYLLYGDLTEAFLHTIALYTLAQVVTALLTPHSAMQLVHGVRARLVFGVFVCLLSLVVLGAALMGIVTPVPGLICFAVLFGAYRALYWTPYMLERSGIERSGISQELFISLMPGIAGIALLDGILGASVLLFAGASILIASFAPLMRVPEMFERYSWGYRQSFAELFEPKYNALVEAAFIQGLQGTALLLLWPMAVFIIVGLSYTSLGLVLTATLLLAALIRPYSMQFLERRVLLHSVLAASSWLLRLVVATPLGVILVDTYSSAGNRPGDTLALEQAADNGTYLDEYTVLKELAMIFGRIFMCIIVGISIVSFTLPVGLAVAFVIAAAASVIGIVHARKAAQAF
jgi:hypothetical protein